MSQIENKDRFHLERGSPLAGKESASSGIRVLVVEDHAMSRRALLKLLKHSGFTAKGVGTLGEGRAQVASFAPQVLILDLMLPDGNGMEILREVRENRLQMKVAVVSGATEPMLSEASRLKPDALFGKPIELADFEAWLREQAQSMGEGRATA